MLYKGEEALSLLHNRANILSWGPPITGKTESVATLPGRIDLYDLDEKCQSFLTAMEKQNRLKDVKIFRYGSPKNVISKTENPTRFSDIYFQLIRDINAYSNMVDWDKFCWKPDSDGPNAVVIDSLTSLGDIVLDAVLAMLGHELSAKGTDARSDYGKQMGKLKEIIDGLKSLPCNFVLTAHEQFVENAQSGEVYTFPLVTGKGTLAPSLPAMFNVVLYSLPDFKWLTRGKGFIKSAGTLLKRDVPPIVDQDFKNVMNF